MSIFSKQNLKVVEVCKDDKDQDKLNNVHFTKEGATVAANGITVMAVSPVQDEWKESSILDETRMLTDETITAETVKDVLKNIGADTKYKGVLEHTDLNQGVFTLSDGKREKKIEAKVYKKEYVRYKDIFQRVFSNSVSACAAVNLKRLISTLQTLDKICPDTTKNSIVYIDFTKSAEGNDMIFRSENVKTKQRAVAVLKAYSGNEGKYLKMNEWECELTGAKKKKMKKLRKIKKIRRL